MEFNNFNIILISLVILMFMVLIIDYFVNGNDDVLPEEEEIVAEEEEDIIAEEEEIVAEEEETVVEEEEIVAEEEEEIVAEEELVIEEEVHHDELIRNKEKILEQALVEHKLAIERALKESEVEIKAIKDSNDLQYARMESYYKRYKAWYINWLTSILKNKNHAELYVEMFWRNHKPNRAVYHLNNLYTTWVSSYPDNKSNIMYLQWLMKNINSIAMRELNSKHTPPIFL